MEFNDLHHINLGIIESIHGGVIDYLVMILIFMSFMAAAFIVGPRALKDVATNNIRILQLLLAFIVIDTIVIMGFFFFALFVERSILNGLLTLIITFLIILNGAGWASITYFFRSKSQRNYLFPLKFYLPMVFFQTLVYLCHIYVYSMFYSFVPHITLFWEWHSLVSAVVMFIMTTYSFLRNIFRNTKDFQKAAISLADEIDVFRKKS